MGNMFVDYESLFKHMDEKIIDVVLIKVSEQIRDMWKQMVDDEFYGKYNPVEYERSWQSLDSISIIKTERIGSNYTVTIAYDESKIKEFSYIGKRSGIERMAHTDIPNQAMFIEYGFEGYGTEREGVHAFEEMLRYIKTDSFKALFNAQVRRLGYDIK